MQHVINSKLNLNSMCCFDVQVSISGQALVFVVRTASHSFFDAAGVLTYVAFFGAQVRLMRASMIVLQRSTALSCHSQSLCKWVHCGLTEVAYMLQHASAATLCVQRRQHHTAGLVTVTMGRVHAGCIDPDCRDGLWWLCPAPRQHTAMLAVP
jgi:hypothetical protein